MHFYDQSVCIMHNNRLVFKLFKTPLISDLCGRLQEAGLVIERSRMNNSQVRLSTPAGTRPLEVPLRSS